MSRKITFTKEEYQALASVINWFDYQMGGLDFKDRENRGKVKERTALGKLYQKMEDAQKPAAAHGMTAAQFLAIFEAWPHGTLPPTEARTSAWYGRLTKAIQGAGITETSLPGLLEYVGTWAKYKMAPESLLGNAGKWLAQVEGNTVTAQDYGPPAGLFEEI